MTVLALKPSRAANAVSELHGQSQPAHVAGLYPEKSVDEVPIGHITNGIHLLGWMKGPVRQLLARNKLWIRHWDSGYVHSAGDFWERMLDPEFVSDEELWALRYQLRRELIEFARRRLLIQAQRASGRLHPFDRLLNPDALTIGFARRFATYKRAPLVFQQITKRSSNWPRDPHRPIQFIFAGKAHPRGRRRQALHPADHSPQQIQRAAGAPGFYRELRRPRRAPDGLRLRRMAEHTATSPGSLRHQRAENPRQRRPEPEHPGRLVARSLRRHQRFCDRRRLSARVRDEQDRADNTLCRVLAKKWSLVFMIATNVAFPANGWRKSVGPWPL